MPKLRGRKPTQALKGHNGLEPDIRIDVDATLKSALDKGKASSDRDSGDGEGGENEEVDINLVLAR